MGRHFVYKYLLMHVHAGCMPADGRIAYQTFCMVTDTVNAVIRRPFAPDRILSGDFTSSSADERETGSGAR